MAAGSAGRYCAKLPCGSFSVQYSSAGRRSSGQLIKASFLMAGRFPCQVSDVSFVQFRKAPAAIFFTYAGRLTSVTLRCALIASPALTIS